MKALWEEKNFRMNTIHSVYNGQDIPFKGVLPDVKNEAQRILAEQKEAGWKVIVYTDGQTIYCAY